MGHCYSDREGCCKPMGHLSENEKETPVLDDQKNLVRLWHCKRSVDWAVVQVASQLSTHNTGVPSGAMG